ncbi:MAG: hypothetical protein B6U95_07930 [Thermofilum sp. ex4484_82]|nr:MAG: hypothetical protein B6U95_07930 [Thermofilum sp. ex4484_82]OYT36826.1 MAG: hypothetical protein B6U96_07930 [Archaeoglobales archaeon ex4484_92]
MKSVKLGDEIKLIVESKISNTLKGIEETLNVVLEKESITFEDLKNILEELESSFKILSQKWVLKILYSLLLKDSMSFNQIKKLLDVNSRTLALKLKELVKQGYVKRLVKQGPPLRTYYTLTVKGRNTALLSIPLLYFITLFED